MDGTGAVSNLSGGVITAVADGIVLMQGTALTAFNQGIITAALMAFALGKAATSPTRPPAR